jgi:hypothetical protein
MTADHAQNKTREIVFFDAHAEHDAYDVLTPQANERMSPFRPFVLTSGEKP